MVLSAIFLAAIANNTTLLAAEPTIGDQFIRKVHAFKKVVVSGQGDWLSAPSPWLTFARQQYWQGLSPAQQKQYLAHQGKGQCDGLVKLEKIGFMRLYPEISGIFSDNIVEKIFSAEFIPSHSFGVRHCQAIGMLNPIMEKEKILDPEFYYLSIHGTDLGNKLEEVHNPRQIVLRKAFTILFDLAACHDYRPAINDILEYNKLYLIFIGSLEKYYFYARAKHYGLQAPDVGIVVEELRQSSLSNPYPQDDPAHKLYAQYSLVHRIAPIQQLLAHDDLDAARKLVFNLTYISCGRSESE